MKEEQRKKFQLENVNLAELQRKNGISHAKLRAWKKNGFDFKSHVLCGRNPTHRLLDGYESVLNTLLTKGISNSSIYFHRLQQEGYGGSHSTIKRYIASYKSLIPAKRQQITSQGNCGRRFVTELGEACQYGLGLYECGDSVRTSLTSGLLCHDLSPLWSTVY